MQKILGDLEILIVIPRTHTPRTEDVALKTELARLLPPPHDAHLTVPPLDCHEAPWRGGRDLRGAPNPSKRPIKSLV